MKKEKPVARRRLYKRRTTMEVLDCSLSAIKKLENAGKLEKLRLLNRDVFHRAEQVDALAAGGALATGDEETSE